MDSLTEYRAVAFAVSCELIALPGVTSASDAETIFSALRRESALPSSDRNGAVAALLKPWREKGNRFSSTPSHNQVDASSTDVLDRVLHQLVQQTDMSHATDSLREILAILILDRVRYQVTPGIPLRSLSQWLRAADRAYFILDPAGNGILGVNSLLQLILLGITATTTSTFTTRADMQTVAMQGRSGMEQRHTQNTETTNIRRDAVLLLSGASTTTVWSATAMLVRSALTRATTTANGSPNATHVTSSVMHSGQTISRNGQNSSQNSSTSPPMLSEREHTACFRNNTLTLTGWRAWLYNLQLYVPDIIALGDVLDQLLLPSNGDENDANRFSTQYPHAQHNSVFRFKQALYRATNWNAITLASAAEAVSAVTTTTPQMADNSSAATSILSSVLQLNGASALLECCASGLQTRPALCGTVRRVVHESLHHLNGLSAWHTNSGSAVRVAMDAASSASDAAVDLWAQTLEATLPVLLTTAAAPEITSLLSRLPLAFLYAIIPCFSSVEIESAHGVPEAVQEVNNKNSTRGSVQSTQSYSSMDMQQQLASMSMPQQLAPLAIPQQFVTKNTHEHSPFLSPTSHVRNPPVSAQLITSSVPKLNQQEVIDDRPHQRHETSNKRVPNSDKIELISASATSASPSPLSQDAIVPLQKYEPMMSLPQLPLKPLSPPRRRVPPPLQSAQQLPHLPSFTVNLLDTSPSGVHVPTTDVQRQNPRIEASANGDNRVIMNALRNSDAVGDMNGAMKMAQSQISGEITAKQSLPQQSGSASAIQSLPRYKFSLSRDVESSMDTSTPNTVPPVINNPAPPPDIVKSALRPHRRAPPAPTPPQRGEDMLGSTSALGNSTTSNTVNAVQPHTTDSAHRSEMLSPKLQQASSEHNPSTLPPASTTSPSSPTHDENVSDGFISPTIRAASEAKLNSTVIPSHTNLEPMNNSSPRQSENVRGLARVTVLSPPSAELEQIPHAQLQAQHPTTSVNTSVTHELETEVHGVTLALESLLGRLHATESGVATRAKGNSRDAQHHSPPIGQRVSKLLGGSLSAMPALSRHDRDMYDMTRHRDNEYGVSNTMKSMDIAADDSIVVKHAGDYYQQHANDDIIAAVVRQLHHLRGRLHQLEAAGPQTQNGDSQRDVQRKESTGWNTTNAAHETPHQSISTWNASSLEMDDVPADMDTPIKSQLSPAVAHGRTNVRSHASSSSPYRDAALRAALQRRGFAPSAAAAAVANAMAKSRKAMTVKEKDSVQNADSNSGKEMRPSSAFQFQRMRNETGTSSSHGDEFGTALLLSPSSPTPLAFHDYETTTQQYNENAQVDTRQQQANPPLAQAVVTSSVNENQTSASSQPSASQPMHDSSQLPHQPVSQSGNEVVAGPTTTTSDPDITHSMVSALHSAIALISALTQHQATVQAQQAATVSKSAEVTSQLLHQQALAAAQEVLQMQQAHMQQAQIQRHTQYPSLVNANVSAGTNGDAIRASTQQNQNEWNMGERDVEKHLHSIDSQRIGLLGNGPTMAMDTTSTTASALPRLPNRPPIRRAGQQPSTRTDPSLDAAVEDHVQSNSMPSMLSRRSRSSTVTSGASVQQGHPPPATTIAVTDETATHRLGTKVSKSATSSPSRQHSGNGPHEQALKIGSPPRATSATPPRPPISRTGAMNRKPSSSGNGDGTTIPHSQKANAAKQNAQTRQRSSSSGSRASSTGSGRGRGRSASLLHDALQGWQTGLRSSSNHPRPSEHAIGKENSNLRNRFHANAQHVDGEDQDEHKGLSRTGSMESTSVMLPARSPAKQHTNTVAVHTIPAALTRYEVDLRNPHHMTHLASPSRSYPRPPGFQNVGIQSRRNIPPVDITSPETGNQTIDEDDPWFVTPIATTAGDTKYFPPPSSVINQSTNRFLSPLYALSAGGNSKTEVGERHRITNTLPIVAVPIAETVTANANNNSSSSSSNSNQTNLASSRGAVLPMTDTPALQSPPQQQRMRGRQPVQLPDLLLATVPAPVPSPSSFGTQVESSLPPVQLHIQSQPLQGTHRMRVTEIPAMERGISAFEVAPMPKPAQQPSSISSMPPPRQVPMTQVTATSALQRISRNAENTLPVVETAKPPPIALVNVSEPSSSRQVQEQPSVEKIPSLPSTTNEPAPLPSTTIEPASSALFTSTSIEPAPSHSNESAALSSPTVEAISTIQADSIIVKSTFDDPSSQLPLTRTYSDASSLDASDTAPVAHRSLPLALSARGILSARDASIAVPLVSQRLLTAGAVETTHISARREPVVVAMSTQPPVEDTNDAITHVTTVPPTAHSYRSSAHELFDSDSASTKILPIGTQSSSKPISNSISKIAVDEDVDSDMSDSDGDREHQGKGDNGVNTAHDDEEDSDEDNDDEMVVPWVLPQRTQPKPPSALQRKPPHEGTERKDNEPMTSTTTNIVVQSTTVKTIVQPTNENKDNRTSLTAASKPISSGSPASEASSAEMAAVFHTLPTSTSTKNQPSTVVSTSASSRSNTEIPAATSERLGSNTSRSMGLQPQPPPGPHPRTTFPPVTASASTISTSHSISNASLHTVPKADSDVSIPTQSAPASFPQTASASKSMNTTDSMMMSNSMPTVTSMVTVNSMPMNNSTGITNSMSSVIQRELPPPSSSVDNELGADVEQISTDSDDDAGSSTSHHSHTDESQQGETVRAGQSTPPMPPSAPPATADDNEYNTNPPDSARQAVIPQQTMPHDEDADPHNEYTDAEFRNNHSDHHDAPEDDNQTEIDTNMLSFTLSLLNGAVFKKHGRQGWPHSRLLYVDATDDMLTLRWGPPNAGVPSSREASIAADAALVSLGDVRDVRTGLSTPTLQRRGQAKNANLYWSLILPDRTLDFEAKTADERDHFATCFRACIDNDFEPFKRGMVICYERGLWKPPAISD